MLEMNQDETYNEELPTDEVEYEDEGNENTSSGIKMPFGLDKKVVFIGAIGVVIVVLVAVLLLTRKTGSSSPEEVIYPSDNTNSSTTSGTVGPALIYAADGRMLGYVNSYTDGETTTDDLGNVIGTFSTTTGTPAVDIDGNSVGYVIESTDTSTSDGSSSDTSSDATYDNSSDTTAPTSSSGEVTEEDLRKLGYTGDEIELAIQMGTSFEELAEEAQALRDEEAKEALIRMSDSASEEFQMIANNSIFCMPKTSFESYDQEASTSTYVASSYTVNADYVKVPTYGYQLLLKCKIANNTYVFYNVTPEQWDRLPESGNIILEISYTLYGTTSTRLYITNIEEISLTDANVNTEDSGSDLNEIIENSKGNADSGYSEDVDDADDGTSSVTAGEWW